LVSVAKEASIGDPMMETTNVGPVTTEPQFKKIIDYINIAKSEGATCVLGGNKYNGPGSKGNRFVEPTIFTDVKNNMRIAQEEVFGPVLSVVRVKTFEEASKLINDHEYGNGVSIYTRDGDAGRTFASKIQVGMVGINVPIPVPMAFHSFGGWKRSLFGDSAMHGMEGIKFYTKLKTITSRWPSGIRSNAEFVMPTMK